LWLPADMIMRAARHAKHPHRPSNFVPGQNVLLKPFPFPFKA
jgi:hypothetical protein